MTIFNRPEVCDNHPPNDITINGLYYCYNIKHKISYNISKKSKIFDALLLIDCYLTLRRIWNNYQLHTY